MYHRQELRELPDLEESKRSTAHGQELRDILDLEERRGSAAHGKELKELLDLEERRGSIDSWAGTRGTSRTGREQRKCFVS